VGDFSFERSVPNQMTIDFLDSFEKIGVCESHYKFVHKTIEHQFLMIVKRRYYRVITFFRNMFDDSILTLSRVLVQIQMSRYYLVLQVFKKDF
jgi:hypothetical protein